MKLSLGFSPCPNDTFIFDAMVHGKIDTEGLEFEVILADVEELNKRAFKQELDITKLSYHTYAYLVKDYVLLDAGSALGNNCGPLLIAANQLSPERIPGSSVAIPGKFTTANFLLSIAYPQLKNKKEVLFSEIENQVLDQQVDMGLIIHENRFTYQDKGLVKLLDLGEFWETKTGLPIPLGGIVVRRNLDKELQKKVNRVMRRSVEFAQGKPEQTMDYVRPHAQEMDPEVMMKHIGLYVNQWTVHLGEEGRNAVAELMGMARDLKLVPESDLPLFLD